MEGFQTQIVQNREVGVQIKGIAVGAVLTGGYFTIMGVQDHSPYLKYFLGTVFLFGLLIALGVFLFKTKTVGSLHTDSNGITFGYLGTEVSIDYLQIRELKLKYPEERKWWNPLTYGNKNCLILETFGDDYFEFKIILKNKNHKEDFHKTLATHKEVVAWFA